MKYRIFYENNRWHVREPNGDVIWHHLTWKEAMWWSNWLIVSALRHKACPASPIIATENATSPPLGDNLISDEQLYCFGESKEILQG